MLFRRKSPIIAKYTPALQKQQTNQINRPSQTSLRWIEHTLVLLISIFLIISASKGDRGEQQGDDDDSRKVDRHNINNNGNSTAFVQIPHSNPPTVRPPPYTISNEECPAINTRSNWVDTLCGDLNTGFVPQNPLRQKFLDGGTYPFDTIKNKTLEFFRKALPILKKNKSLPKVARYTSATFQPTQKKNSSPAQRRHHHHVVKRGIATRQAAYPSPLSDPYFPDDANFYADAAPLIYSTSRRRRQYGPGPSSQTNHNRFCENAMNYYNRLCKIYNLMWGKSPHKIQRETSIENRYYRPTTNNNPIMHQVYNNKGLPHHHPHRSHHLPRPSIDVTVIEPAKSPKNLNMNHHHHVKNSMNSLPISSSIVSTATASAAASPTSQNVVEMPPTPCPSTAEYMTPVFARNHEGAWRYVVQIPKEGYFTQTVEVTKCLKSTCYYMEGNCKTSPRWQSLLVAELYYPDASFPTTVKPHFNGNDFDREQNDLYTGASTSSSNSTTIKSKTDPSQCDGLDNIGCYQVRLFYDWFLIPGSCKCWKSQFDFSKRSQSSTQF